MRLKVFSFFTLSTLSAFYAWPDGAPCLHSTIDSMNPLEAAEHQGGLQLSNPPYTIDVSRKCYWRNQPVQLTLRGNTTTDVFRGFVIQPLVYKGYNQGQRVGQFLRLDDNGSWQQQCFRLKSSVTHSHDEKKKKITLWWKSEDDESNYIHATVVKAQREFWVKAVVSAPLPPCIQDNQGLSVQDFFAPPPTVPPPVKSFKLDTAREFHNEDALRARSVSETDLRNNLKISLRRSAVSTQTLFKNTVNNQRNGLLSHYFSHQNVLPLIKLIRFILDFTLFCLAKSKKLDLISLMLIPFV